MRLIRIGAALALAACAPLPEGTTVQISPAEPGELDELRASLQGDVGTLGTVVWTWAWLRDGATTDFDGTLVPAEATTSGEVWRVVAFPTVGTRRGGVITDEVVIGGGEVTSGTLSLSPAEPVTSDDIVASLADVSEGEWTWAWTVDDALVDATGTVLPARFTAKGQRIVASATPEEGPAISSAAVVVGNSPPTAPRVEVLPEDPLTTDTLQCRLLSTANDPDDDRLDYSFSWTLGDAPWNGEVARTSFPGDSIPASALDNGQTWSCSATASDGEAASPASARSAPVRVLAPNSLVPGNTRLEMSRDGWSVRCIEWRGTSCTHWQQRVDCGTCSTFEACDVWHDTTRYNNGGDDRTARSLCAIATGSASVDAVSSGGGASAPAACGFSDEDHPICARARASVHVPGAGIAADLGLLLHPDYCDEDPTLLHVDCDGW